MTPRISCRRGGFRWLFSLLLLPLSGILTVFGTGRLADGQPVGRGIPGGMAGGMADHTVPTQAYHAAFGDFYDGDYRAALEHFKADSRGAVKTTQSRWIDSICYETMVGECYYQMGQYSEALPHYTNALEIYQAFPTWLSQVVFQAIRADSGGKKPAPWQVRRLQAPIGQLPYRMSLGQGQIDASSAIKQGGVIEQPNLFPIEPAEILRLQRWRSAGAVNCSVPSPPTIRFWTT